MKNVFISLPGENSNAEPYMKSSVKMYAVRSIQSVNFLLNHIVKYFSAMLTPSYRANRAEIKV